MGKTLLTVAYLGFAMAMRGIAGQMQGFREGRAAAEAEAKAIHDTVAAEMRDAGFCRWVALASQEQHCATPAARPAAARDPDHDGRR